MSLKAELAHFIGTTQYWLGGKRPKTHYEEDVEYSDFPFEDYSLYVGWDEGLGGWVVMLTSEY